jgi:hypothetical protein
MNIELFTQLQTKGYVVTNKRVVGNPKFTSEETKVKDLVQEYALVIEWLRVTHGIWISVFYKRHSELKHYGYNINYPDGRESKLWEFNTPQEAISAAIDYTLKELI